MIASAREPRKPRIVAPSRNGTFTINKLDVEDRRPSKLSPRSTAAPAIDVLINTAGLLAEMKAQAGGSLDYARAVVLSRQQGRFEHDDTWCLPMSLGRRGQPVYFDGTLLPW